MKATIKNPKMALSFYVGILLLVLGCITCIYGSKIQVTTTEVHEEVVNHLVTVTTGVNQEKQVHYMGIPWVLPDSGSAFLPLEDYRKSEPGISKVIKRNLFYIESSDEFLDRTVITKTDFQKKAKKTRRISMAIVLIVVGLGISGASLFKSKHSGFSIPV